jgi:O-acetyl-ADP-ribose deacetylase
VTRVSCVRGDLTEQDVDAIVNAANERMLGGGGVDGAIHRAAGKRLLEACKEIPEVRPGVRCPTGEARITPGFDLVARWVVHTVGPVYQRRSVDAALLASAHQSSLALAREKGLRTVAFPAISCGVYGYPPRLAAPIAIAEARAAGGSIEEVRFVLFGADTFEPFDAAARAG